MYILCRENKGFDKLFSHHSPDQRLCFHIMQILKAGFLVMQLIPFKQYEQKNCSMIFDKYSVFG